MFTQNNSMLPIEIENNEAFDEDEIFDSQRHRSHLLDCKGRQNDWERVKKIYIQFPQKTLMNK